MNKNQTVLIVAGVLLGLPVLSCGGCLMLGMLASAIDPTILEEPAPAVAPTNATVEEAYVAPPPPQSRVTMANFNRIQTGMTYDEVVAILGPPTEQNSQVEIAGQRSAMFTWKADNWLGNMNITFSNGTVMAKGQLGLE